MLTMMLTAMPVSYAAVDYSVKHWTNQNGENDLIDYYTVYQGTLASMYEPNFYCEERDHYYNIYTGWDVEITFYRQYGNTSPEQGVALYKYLTSHSDNEYCCGGCYYYSSDDSVYVWLIEGWDLFDLSLDPNDLWNRDFWMNTDATGLYLEYLGQGQGRAIKDYADELGCSGTAYVKSSGKDETREFSFGFHFVEGTDDHVVKRYCPDETW